MHVRIAWEILHHQKKENPEKTSTAPNLTKAAAAPADMHRPPSHIFPSSASVLPRPPELSTTFPPGLQGRPYDPASIPSGFLAGPTSHLGIIDSLDSSSLQLVDHSLIPIPISPRLQEMQFHRSVVMRHRSTISLVYNLLEIFQLVHRRAYMIHGGSMFMIWNSSKP